MIALHKKQGLIGIDLGRRSVKLAQLTESADGLELRRTQSIPRLKTWQETPELPVSSNEEMIAAWGQGGNWIGKRTACSLPISVCPFQVVEVRASDQEALQREVQREVERRQLTADPYSLEYWTAQGHPGNNTLTPRYCLNLYGMREDWALQISQDHRSSGLKCQVLDATPVAMARCVQLAGESSTAPLAVLDWGYGTVTMTIVHEERPAFVRCCPYGALSHLTHLTKQSLKCDEKTAEHYLREAGLADPDSPQPRDRYARLRDAWNEELANMADELAMVLGFLQSHHPRLAPNRMLVIGGGGMLSHVERFLQDQLQIPVRRWRMLRSADAVHEPADDEPLFAIAAALSFIAYE